MSDRTDDGSSDRTADDAGDRTPDDEAGDGADEDAPSLAPDELLERLRSGERLTVLDVRDRDEFEEWHLEGPGVEAVQVPHVRFIQAEVTGGAADLVADLEEPILAVCGRGEASDHVVGLLDDEGIDAANLAGGMDAWAELLVPREVGAGGPATVVQYDRPSSGCLSYGVFADGEAAVIDPLRAFADRYAADADDRGCDLRYAVDTHVHADHVSGVRELARETGAEPVVPAGARDRGLAFDATLLEDGDDLAVGPATLSAVATPGHTSESLSYRLDDLLFTGDALFLGGVGRPDLESGSEGATEAARRLYESLRERILPLPDETVVCPGHYESSGATGDGPVADRLGAIRERVDALSLEREAFVERVGTDLPPRPNNFERIVAINLGREEVEEERAFELELGPNNCAVGG